MSSDWQNLQLFTAKLDFYKSVCSVSQVYDSIAFQTVLVAIMINFAAERIRKYAQVADTQYFKKKAKCSEIGKQILRSALKRGCCNRGVDIYRVSEERIAVLDRMLGFPAGISSATKILRSTFRYEATVSASIDASPLTEMSCTRTVFGVCAP